MTATDRPGPPPSSHGDGQGAPWDITGNEAPLTTADITAILQTAYPPRAGHIRWTRAEQLIRDHTTPQSRAAILAWADRQRVPVQDALFEEVA
ncbi:hypothetical protein [Actinomadura rugatobispora]|uniref:Uncharacterized protein n=1 Tax=Actinomadura rugatobispora TaxID=1994 RepID=A0ABW0ZVF3_9ACTN|nr:hypothetical protein GCM10010200_036010 [Actinomadura rugatobispora]